MPTHLSDLLCSDGAPRQLHKLAAFLDCSLEDVRSGTRQQGQSSSAAASCRTIRFGPSISSSTQEFVLNGVKDSAILTVNCVTWRWQCCPLLHSVFATTEPGQFQQFCKITCLHQTTAGQLQQHTAYKHSACCHMHALKPMPD